MMTELRITREKLVAIGSEHVNEKEIEGLAAVGCKCLGETDRRQRPNAI